MSGSFRHLYREALPLTHEPPAWLHFAAHSHHPWPDATLNAQIQFWRDSNRLLDQKWEYFQTEIIPKARKNIAQAMGITAHDQITIAPNTHEFVARIFSSIDDSKEVHVLTTDAEFHSFARQARRYEELENVHIHRVPVEPFETFQERFVAAAAARIYDLVFFSHVFYNSGFVVKDLEQIIRACDARTRAIVIDAYHSFFALPIRLSPEVQRRAFALGGGYKYAQSGEGICWLYVPPACHLRPRNTGWFAEFADLAEVPVEGAVRYADGGARFAGATFDLSGTYRFNAVCDLYAREGLSVESVHDYVLQLKSKFIEMWIARPAFQLPATTLLRGEEESHFVTFRTPRANDVYKELEKIKIRTDARGDRLRFGFGLYQDPAMLDELFKRIRSFS